MVEKALPGKSAIKLETVSHTHRKKKKITRGDKPGNIRKNPQPQPVVKKSILISIFFITQSLVSST
jgi:hypothetical protein